MTARAECVTGEQTHADVHFHGSPQEKHGVVAIFLNLFDLKHSDDRAGHREIPSRKQDDQVDLVAGVHLQSDEQRYWDEESDDIAHNCDGCCGLKDVSIGKRKCSIASRTFQVR